MCADKEIIMSNKLMVGRLTLIGEGTPEILFKSNLPGCFPCNMEYTKYCARSKTNCKLPFRMCSMTFRVCFDHYSNIKQVV